jgi:hypothetical protein
MLLKFAGWNWTAVGDNMNTYVYMRFCTNLEINFRKMFFELPRRRFCVQFTLERKAVVFDRRYFMLCHFITRAENRWTDFTTARTHGCFLCSS